MMQGWEAPGPLLVLEVGKGASQAPFWPEAGVSDMGTGEGRGLLAPM